MLGFTRTKILSLESGLVRVPLLDSFGVTRIRPVEYLEFDGKKVAYKRTGEEKFLIPGVVCSQPYTYRMPDHSEVQVVDVKPIRNRRLKRKILEKLEVDKAEFW